MGVRHTETNLIVWSALAEESAAGVAYSATLPVIAKSELNSIFGADQLYDAGDRGCASGPLDEIARIIRGMASGQTLEIKASDPSVEADLSAWCRMTGHTLEQQREQRYLVRKA